MRDNSSVPIILIYGEQPWRHFQGLLNFHRLSSASTFSRVIEIGIQGGFMASFESFFPPDSSRNQTEREGRKQEVSRREERGDSACSPQLKQSWEPPLPSNPRIYTWPLCGCGLSRGDRGRGGGGVGVWGWGDCTACLTFCANGPPPFLHRPTPDLGQ